MVNHSHPCRLLTAAALAVATLAALLLTAAAAGQAEPRAAARWRPAPTTAPWQWQLQGRVDLSAAAPVFDVDGFETGAAKVRALHRRGRDLFASPWEPCEAGG